MSKREQDCIRYAECWLRRIDYVVQGRQAVRGEFRAEIAPNGDITLTGGGKVLAVSAEKVAQDLGRQLEKA